MNADPNGTDHQQEEIRQRYLAVDASNVADVLDDLGLRDQGLAPGFRPFPHDAGRLAGWAFTIAGEMVPLGFQRWYRTWGTGLGDTARVYWEYDGSALSMEDLPRWASDSPAQRAETARVYAVYNAETSSTPAVEEAFGRLAAERVRAANSVHPQG